ncbi:MAG: RluA family pseudouridine synthase [Candidatus Omnitrophica bacterium]|nr:RluA family pseudouridine synthase [Candidatus Omnitrophota bacterium]MCM8798714.1 RluA family pseudouridine synthase [Candidatus Omnitrophota bacterium]
MLNCKIIYEDRWLLVADKPSGMLTLPFSCEDKNSLLQLLEKKGNLNLFPCHRLDKETSGLVIFAKDKTTQKKIMDLFRRRKIKKKYIGVVQGWVEKKRGRIKNYLFTGLSRRLAITDYRVIWREPEYSLLEIEPLTGRKNQIRIHFKQIGHPVVGERRFAYAKDYPLTARRLLLHALELEFEHPENGKRLKLSSPLPQEIKIFWRREEVR